MVEAAAFGAPSIVNGGGKVGAALMLGEGTGCISVDLERILELNDDIGARREIAKRLRTLLTPIDRSWVEEEEEEDGEVMGRYDSLRQIANEARSRILGWDEMVCSRGLVDILNGVPPSLRSHSLLIRASYSVSSYLYQRFAFSELLLLLKAGYLNLNRNSTLKCHSVSPIGLNSCRRYFRDWVRKDSRTTTLD